MASQSQSVSAGSYRQPTYPSPTVTVEGLTPHSINKPDVNGHCIPSSTSINHVHESNPTRAKPAAGKGSSKATSKQENSPYLKVSTAKSNSDKSINLKEAAKDGQEEEKAETGKGPEEDDSDASEHMDVGSDRDSGCASECPDLSPVSTAEKEFGDTSSTAVDSTSNGDTSKPRGKRRYYMYGNHKLIKPIKEIPLRFQMLLSETRAAKARCEGQPIYMQQQPALEPSYDLVYFQPSEESQQLQASQIQQFQAQQPLNANASCFVPSQGSDSGMTFVPEDFNMAAMGVSSSSEPSLQPTPLFIPSPAMAPSSQPGPTILVYSSTASGSPYLPPTSMVCGRSSHAAQPTQPALQQTIAMPPPPFPPHPSIPPPPLEPSNPSHLYPSLATRPQNPSSNFTSTTVVPNVELDSKKKSSKPLNLNLPIQYSCASANHKVNPSPMSMPSGQHPATTNMVPYLSTTMYPKPSSTQSPMAVDSFAPPPPPVSVALPPTASGAASTVCMAQRGAAGGQYMYLYPSTPTGVAPPSSSAQGPVMYMVGSPTHAPTPVYPSPNYQQGLIMPSVAAQ